MPNTKGGITMNDLTREHIRHIRYRWLAGESLGRIWFDYKHLPMDHLRAICQQVETTALARSRKTR